MNRPHPGAVEERSATDLLAADEKKIRGRIPYGVESRDLGGWREVIEPGALNVAKLDDLVVTVDHAGVPLGRYPHTLELEDRAGGLHWAVTPPASRVDIREAIERRDLNGGSWRMRVARDEWRGDVRYVHEIAELLDVAVVVTGAYSAEAAPVEIRSAPEHPTPAVAPEKEIEMQVEDRTQGAGLAVEDRSVAPEPTVEERVLEAIRSVHKGESRSLATTTAAAIAPDDVSNFLFEKLSPQSVLLRSGVRVIATNRDQVVFPKLSGDVTPAFYNELQAITASDPTFVSLTATPRKLAALVQMSNEIVDDSDPSIVDILNTHIARILALRLDIAAFEGSGTAPEIRGLRNVAGITTQSMGANGAALTNLDPISDAIATLEANNATAGAIVMPPRTFNAIRKLKTADGAPLLGDGVNATTARVFGVPVYVSGQLSTTETQGTATNASSIYVYDAGQVVLVRRNDASIELDRSRLFNQDASEMRGTLRADLLVPNPTAVVRIARVL